jgi:AcrR family transcriptional regulator
MATVGRKIRWNGSVAGVEEQRELKRLAILRAAARMFNERGFHETSIADIAASLHVTKPTLYYYVESKEDMLAQIAALALAGAEALFDSASRDGVNALDALRIFVRGYVEQMTNDFGRCLLTIRHTRVAPAVSAEITAGFRRIDAFARALLTAGMRDGSIRDCDVRIATFALYGAINWVPNWFDEDGPLSPVEAGDALFAIFANGVATERPAAVSRGVALGTIGFRGEPGESRAGTSGALAPRRKKDVAG